MVEANEENMDPRLRDLSEKRVFVVLGTFWMELAAVESLKPKSLEECLGISKVFENWPPCEK